MIKRFVLLPFIALILLPAGCLPPPSGNSTMLQSLENIPNENFVFYLALRPGDMLDSPLYQRIVNEAFAEEWEELKAQVKQNAGVLPSEVTSIVFAMGMPEGGLEAVPAAYARVEAPVNEEDFARLLNSNTPDENEELLTNSYKGRSYLTMKSGMEDANFISSDGGVVVATDSVIKKYIDLLEDGGESLAGNERAGNTLGMVSAGAQLVISFWGFDEQIMQMLSLDTMAGFVQDERLKTALIALNDIEGLTLSLWLDEGATMEFGMLFASSASADDFAKAYQDILDNPPEEMAMPMMPSPQDQGIDPQELQEIADSVSIKSSGKTVIISVSIPGSSSLWDSIIARAKAQKELLNQPAPGPSPQEIPLEEGSDPVVD